MPKVTFKCNLSKIEGHIKKEDTFHREAISSTERLAVCLRQEESSHNNYSVLVHIIVRAGQYLNVLYLNTFTVFIHCI